MGKGHEHKRTNVMAWDSKEYKTELLFSLVNDIDLGKRMIQSHVCQGSGKQVF